MWRRTKLVQNSLHYHPAEEKLVQTCFVQAVFPVFDRDRSTRPPSFDERELRPGVLQCKEQETFLDLVVHWVEGVCWWVGVLCTMLVYDFVSCLWGGGVHPLCTILVFDFAGWVGGGRAGGWVHSVLVGVGLGSW